MSQASGSFPDQQAHDRQRLLERLLEEHQARHGIDLRQDPLAMDRLEEAVAQAVEELETRPSTEIQLPYLSVDTAGPHHLVREISRDDLRTESGAEDSRQLPDRSPPRPAGRVIRLPQRVPYVTYGLLALSVLVYLLQLATQAAWGQDLPAALGLKVNQLILQGQYWRLLSPMLLHGSFIHLGFNMYALNILGRRLERFFGHSRFLGLYLISGFAGNILSFLLTDAPSLGSSTAIFGLLGAEGVFIYQHRKLFGEQFEAGLRQIIMVAAVNILIGLSPGIDNWGHIGGLAGGILFSWFGGPVLEIEGISPRLELVDQRSESTTGLVFVILGLLLALLVGLVITLRTG